MVKVSTIIPIHEGEGFVEPLLSAIAGQSLASDELWLVETDPQPQTRALAEKFGAIYVAVEAADFDHAETRSQIANRASGEYLIFLSQDVLPADPGAFEKLLAPMIDDPEIAATYGRQIPDPGAHPIARIKRRFNYPDRSLTKSYQDRDRLGLRTASLSNAFAAYRREALCEVGFFGERQLMCEDVRAAAALLLAGHKIHYTSDACAHHTHEHGLWREFRRYFDIGAAHSTQPWIVEHFGRPTREGFSFVAAGCAYLKQHGHPARIPEFLLRCALGQIAFSLGKHHRRLPTRLCRGLSSFPRWWQRAEPVIAAGPNDLSAVQAVNRGPREVV